MTKGFGVFLILLVLGACGGSKVAVTEDGKANEADGITTIDSAGDSVPLVDATLDTDATSDSDALPIEDTVIPEDILVPDIPLLDIPPDAVAPPGCCLTHSDCNDPDAASSSVCAGFGLGEPDWAGVCMPAAGEAGRCWSDSECPNGQICHGESLCGCGMDCDMDMMMAPGICITPNSVCQTIQPTWAEEICNAASIVVWDGEACVETCPGCCGCQGWCDYAFQTIADCQNACTPPGCVTFDGSCDDAIPDSPWWYWNGNACVMEDSCVCEGCPGTFATLEECKGTCNWTPSACPTYIAARADSYHGLFKSESGCPSVSAMSVRCKKDADCEGLANPGLPDLGDTCVLGNCVWCWNDDECQPGLVCRAGRCVDSAPLDCPNPGTCDAPNCHLITPSESPCPVCACDEIYNLDCHTDLDCLPFSFHPFSRCVYGRCVDCRNDDDCDWGRCMQPGMCWEMTPPEDMLFGTWLLGWAGGMDHFSYFRFETDGTFRRSAYDTSDPVGAWADDVPSLYQVCDPGGPVPAPLVGTWEPEVTASGYLLVRVSLNLPCATGQGWTDLWAVNWLEGSPWTANFEDIDGDMNLMGWKVDGTACFDDFSVCPVPDYPW